jgi:hypothetical protein
VAFLLLANGQRNYFAFSKAATDSTDLDASGYRGAPNDVVFACILKSARNTPPMVVP